MQRHAPELHLWNPNEYHIQRGLSQGLEFHNDTSYRKQPAKKGSPLWRQVDYTNGEILKKNKNLDNTYFVEGNNILNEKTLSTLLKVELEFIYDLKDFRQQ